MTSGYSLRLIAKKNQLFSSFEAALKRRHSRYKKYLPLIKPSWLLQKGTFNLFNRWKGIFFIEKCAAMEWCWLMLFPHSSSSRQKLFHIKRESETKIYCLTTKLKLIIFNAGWIFLLSFTSWWDSAVSDRKSIFFCPTVDFFLHLFHCLFFLFNLRC